jgi:DNA repair exonuclease SbcCD ATPase subunit
MIKSLSLFNAGPFLGEHHLHLESKAYAITARYESDRDRSNWGGKSFLQEMIDFALTGRLNKDRRYDADGWITKGERTGLVELALEGGVVIRRERTRGSATRITMKTPDRAAASQAGAEQAILDHLGFDADDFRQLAYFEQGKMARLVLTEPEKRMDIVRGWLGIERAEQAEAAAGKLVVERVREVQQLRQRRMVVEEWLGQLKDQPDVTALATEVDRLAKAIASAQDARYAALTAGSTRAAAEQTVARYDALVAEGKELAAYDEANPNDLQPLAAQLQEEWGIANAAHVNASREAFAKKKVSLGLFDGKCPVAPIECPARTAINADRGGSQAAYRTALEEEIAAKVVLDRVRDQARLLLEQSEIQRTKRTRLTELRKMAAERALEAKLARKTLKAKSDATQGADEALAQVRHEHSLASASLALARGQCAQREKLTAELTAITDTIERVAALAAVATQTRAVFRATQRRVAERALAIIGGGANAMLSGAGIDLGVEVRWEYEGKGAARACEDCGAAFPASLRVKTCEQCGADRGQNIVKRLEFLRTDQSGAANDLAGVSLQLAAGSWLLASRGSPWATAILDEPLAQCDKTNRKTITTQLVKLLGQGTWRQALVISHSNDTLDAFPGRIEVLVHRNGRRSIHQF